MELEGVRDSGDDGCVEAEEKAAEGSGESALDEKEDGIYFWRPCCTSVRRCRRATRVLEMQSFWRGIERVLKKSVSC